MQDFFVNNYRILSTRWPDLARAIASVAVECDYYLTETPSPALVVEGQQLYSGYDPDSEATDQLGFVPADSAEVFVYGVGSGLAIEQLLARQSVERVNVVMMALDVGRLSFSLRGHHRWLSDPRVFLELATVEHRLQKPFVHNPALLTLADKSARRLVEDISLHFGAFQSNHVYRDSMDFEALAEEVEPYIRNDGDVASLFGAHHTKPVVVVAGGPSTDHYAEALQSIRDDVLIVALITAYPSLLGHGLVPDFVVAMDPGTEVAVQLGYEVPKGHEPTLVYFPSVAVDGLQAWPFKRLVGYAEEEQNFAALAERYPRGALCVDGSTVISAISLALKMGTKDIWLLGADFAYPGGQTHSSGAFFSRAVKQSEVRYTVEGEQGNELWSSLRFIGYLRSVEGLIAEHPGVDFRNLSAIGAKIEGARYLDATSC